MHQICLDALILMACLSGIPIIAVSLASGCVALIQAATQIQEQSVMHLVRCVTLAVVIAVFGQYGAAEVERFFIRILEMVGALGAQ